MGFDIDSLVGKSVETEVPFAGETTVVHYNPNVLTRERIEQAEQDDNGFMAYFVELVNDWDVTQGGAKVPLKIDALAPVPITFLRAVFMHILRESSAGQMGKVSNAPSRRRTPQDRKSPSGTRTSKRRSTSG